MMVDPATARFRADLGGVTYYFCSGGCRSKFVANPSAHAKQTVAPKPVAGGVIYTCPMHPQIRQNGPGNCPICGMTLEPLTATSETGPSPELTDMSRRFWIALALTLPVFVLEMGSHVPTLNLARTIPATTSSWIQFALSTPVVLWAGWPFFARGWASLRNRSLNMFTLIALELALLISTAWLRRFCRTCFPWKSGTRG